MQGFKSTGRRLRGALALGGMGLAALVVLGAAPRAVTADREAPHVTRPDAHFILPDPAKMNGDEAFEIYDEMLPLLVKAYALSGLPAARHYSNWLEAAKNPFPSATHGNRYVQVRVNWLAAGYLTAGRTGRLPPGALIAKDSFTATANGDVFPGPLFLMERLEEGTSPATDDWRYAMVMPDGSILGDTQGFNPEAMGFCASCHANDPAANDHLFYVPVDVRVSAD